ncbi:zinc transporter ZIP10 [Elysia marginata]|uniref:Zinc transporter ZIP10 n=1 Tax=Elysia marginata TaxID=1093978 RepID=A0AAV4HQ79_9GAST|nr:zinc transporter ZIP10 [Elysia marginata]
MALVKLRLCRQILMAAFLALLMLNLAACLDDHDHGDHAGHSHDHDHEDHEGHDHDHEGHDHGDHEGHDHEDHEGHDHGDHEGHDHGDHEGHDHEDHEGHDHGDHQHGENGSSPFHEHIHLHENGSSAFNVSVDNIAREESLFFVKKLFQKYGAGAGMTHSNLIALLKEIGIDVDKMKDKETTSRIVTRSVTDVQHVHSNHDECGTIKDMLDAFHLSTSHVLTPMEFSYLCPAIIYRLDLAHCRAQKSYDHNHDNHHDHDHDHDDHSHHHHHDHEHDHEEHDHHEEEAAAKHIGFSSIPKKVWGYSCVAVLVISLVGLLGVAVIPIMQKVFYNHLLQFLVALAIGALSGDALLHLLPHAIQGNHDHSKHNHGEDGHGDEEIEAHRLAAYKGLVAFVGILFFFVAERLLTIITVIKRNNKSQKHLEKKRCEKYCDIESNKNSVKAKLSHRQLSDDGCDKALVLVHPNKALRGLADAAHEEFMHQCDEEQSPGNGDGNLIHHHNHHQNKIADSSFTTRDEVGGDEKDGELAVMFSKDFEEGGDGEGHAVTMSSGHSHGSHRGHSHSVPDSVAAVAWMVILGDGIHNFSDGLAIGAAFANSITGGFSTSIAVFCHELPHEIGDFAVLLRAGMSTKQAIWYNCLSSILCFIGMLIGIALGNMASATDWIFACVGGMFLYIALVDMLPEMTSVDPKKGENPFLHLFLQVIGIILGSTIMLLIAIFEHDIKTTFDE